jgi:hypothetical protein
MKKIFIIILMVWVGNNKAYCQNNKTYTTNTKDILIKKTTISVDVLDRVVFALEFYEQQKIKANNTMSNNPKKLEIALQKIAVLKQKQLNAIIPATELKKLSTADISAICK